MRCFRILVGGIVLAVLVQIAQTTPYLGLPFEPKPTECYDQAKWNGQRFVPTGQTICLSD